MRFPAIQTQSPHYVSMKCDAKLLNLFLLLSLSKGGTCNSILIQMFKVSPGPSKFKHDDVDIVLSHDFVSAVTHGNSSINGFVTV